MCDIKSSISTEVKVLISMTLCHQWYSKGVCKSTNLRFFPFPFVSMPLQNILSVNMMHILVVVVF